jgi:hypothetical protein
MAIDWFNHLRLFHQLGRIPPAEYEDHYYQQTESDQRAATHATEPA